jgi:transposase
MKYVAPLTEIEIQTLHEMHSYHPTRRARMRAHSILFSHQGYSIPQIARLYEVDRRSVSIWLDRWQQAGLVGLYDEPHTGRPPRLSEAEQHTAQQLLRQFPREIKRVVAELAKATGKRVSPKTRKRLLKKTGSVWKRIRKVPAKKPDPVKYAHSQALLQRLQQQDAAGECDLWYFDGSGFCLEPYLPYAWQPIGDTLEIPTSSHGKRLNVLGFLNRQNKLVSYMIEGSVDTEVIIACMDQFSQQLTQRTYVFVDNAPMHRSHDFIHQIPKWVKRGLIIKYLPSYSPPLNLIEILWRFMKYTWLPFSAYTSFASLCQAVAQILKQFGTEYRIDFKTV